jgi:glutathione S-transferase
MLTLYSTPRSANGRKVLAVTRHLGLTPNIRDVNVYAGEGRSPAHLAIHPLGKIPVLVDGDFTLTESNAILLYLCEVYGDQRLTSTDPQRRAEVLRWLFWEASEWQPALVPLLAGFVGQKLGLTTARPPIVVDWSDARFRRLGKYLDDCLRARAFLLGDLTVADFSVAAMMMYVGGARFPYEDFLHIRAWFTRVEALEAWQGPAVEPWA